MNLNGTAGETEVDFATFGCSFLDLELTLASALADTISISTLH